MRERYLKQLDKLNLDLYTMCGSVVRQIDESISALKQGDISIAARVVSQDDSIDDMEKLIERECLQLLLRQQPVANDFRRISSILKMITDLERVGDHAEDIADLVIKLHDTGAKDVKYIGKMCDVVKVMVSVGVESFILSDLAAAKTVPPMDDELDELFKDTKKTLSDALHDDLYKSDDILSLLMIAKYLERIGDHAVNISEWTMYYEKNN